MQIQQHYTKTTHLCACNRLGLAQHAERLLQQCQLLLVSNLLPQVLQPQLQGMQLAALLTSGHSHASANMNTTVLCKMVLGIHQRADAMVADAGVAVHLASCALQV
jgi:hypothetical protein